MTLHICFDVLGTCFGLEKLAQAIESEFKRQLNSANVNAQVVAMLWYYSVKRDFAFKSTIGEYTPIAKVFKASLKRTLLIALEHSDEKIEIKDDQVERITAALKTMAPRPGLAKALQDLEKAGCELYGVTNGGAESTQGLFEQVEKANSCKLQMAKPKRILSCDDIKIAKPDLRVYDAVISRIQSMEADASKDNMWFVAAHSWDLAAARKKGFKTAYLTFEEHDQATDIYGQADVVVPQFSELANAILNHS